MSDINIPHKTGTLLGYRPLPGVPRSWHTQLLMVVKYNKLLEVYTVYSVYNGMTYHISAQHTYRQLIHVETPDGT
jgi:hypothetical protein